MTNLQAIQVEVKPYEADALDCEKALAGACKRTGKKLAIADDYDCDNDKVLALAAVLVLQKYLSLTSEAEGEWKQGYTEKGLEARIKALCKANDLDSSEFVDEEEITISDGSRYF